VLVALGLAGCLTSMHLETRRAEAVRLVQFEGNCQAQIVDQMLGADHSMRFKLAGCGRVWLVLCENVTNTAMGAPDPMVDGVLSAQTRCTIQR